jgi:eukaryotic-like serine/threonine-protein kinase
MARTSENVRYAVLRPLGSGGMADVRLGYDTVLGRSVALKRVRAASGVSRLKRVRREALVGASLSHPNLVSVYDVIEEDNGDLVIVMEYVAGDTLQELIRKRGALPPARALPILEGVARALDAVHRRGIVHRDVKPGNILLGVDGAIKLADLGIAAVDDRTKITTAGEVLGTFSYMAPEQLEGESSQRAMDIYALAAVAFEVLCGRRARRESNPVALAHAIATRPAPDLRDCWAQAPPAAAEVLKGGMAADPAKRPRTAGELVGKLRAAIALTPAPAPVPRTRARPTPPAVAVAPALAQQHRAGGSVRRMPAANPPGPPSNGSDAAPQKVAVPKVNQPARRQRMAALALALLAAMAVVGVSVAALSSGGAGKHSGSNGPTAQATRAPTRRAQPRRSHRSSTASVTGRSGQAGGSAGPVAAAPPPAASANGAAASAITTNTGAGLTTPSDTVQAFYEAAARHDYSAAWQLADNNMRNQLNGFDSFQGQMSRVRLITFHQARTLAGSTPSLATVALQTTAVLVDRTQNCSGTAQTLRVQSGAWLLDHISISCTPA